MLTHPKSYLDVVSIQVKSYFEKETYYKRQFLKYFVVTDHFLSHREKKWHISLQVPMAVCGIGDVEFGNNIGASARKYTFVTG